MAPTGRGRNRAETEEEDMVVCEEFEETMRLGGMAGLLETLSAKKPGIYVSSHARKLKREVISVVIHSAE